MVTLVVEEHVSRGQKRPLIIRSRGPATLKKILDSLRMVWSRM